MPASQRPSRQRYIAILRAMTPDDRMRRIDKLNDRMQNLLRQKLRAENPTLSAPELQKLYIQRRIEIRNQKLFKRPIPVPH